MFCIQVPMSEMPWPKKKRRKFRCERAPKRGAGTTATGGEDIVTKIAPTPPSFSPGWRPGFVRPVRTCVLRKARPLRHIAPSPMRYTTYSRYLPELADTVNLQGLLDQLADFLLQSGFAGGAYSHPFWGEF